MCNVNENDKEIKNEDSKITHPHGSNIPTIH